MRNENEKSSLEAAEFFIDTFKNGVVSKCWHNLFLYAKPRLSQARALLLPKVLVSLGISFRYGKV
ncbi:MULTISPECIES: hypothetical protein, partial [Bacteroides]|uniref:hypothetical protein n=1 Tax=Bacteroides TaxID=816 RepID=UPI001C8F28D1